MADEQERAEDPRGSVSDTFAAMETIRGVRASSVVPARHELPPLPMGQAEGLPDLVTKQVLGEGGMGVVYRAEQRSLMRDVAVKTLRQNRGSPADVDTFVREAWVTGYLAHPNIPSVHALGVDAKGRPTLVMEEVRGETWEKRLATRTHSTGISSALDADLVVFEQVCNAVEYAHSRGVLHRDLKPANVMIGPFGEVLVLDWGLAVAIDDEAARRIQRASEITGVSGTPAYMAPEMARGDAAALGPATDVFLLGAMLYEVALGFPPNLGGTVQATLRRAALGVMPRFPDELPTDLRRILERALAPKPSDRYPSVTALRLAVADHRIHREVRALVLDADAHAELIGEGSVADALQHFQKARFAYQLAARSLGHDAVVREALERAGARMATRYLDAGDATAALSLLDELGLDSRDLRAQARASLDGKAETDRELRALREVAKSVDVASGASTRIRAFTLIALLWGAPAAVAGRLVALGRIQLDYASRLAILGIGVTMLTGALLAMRTTILSNAINRRLVGFGILIGTMVFANAALCFFLHISFPTSLVVEMAFTQFVLTTFAIFLHRELAAAAFVHAPFVFAAVAYPKSALELLGYAVVLANATMVLAEWRLARTEVSS